VSGNDREFGPGQFLHQPAKTDSFLCQPQKASVIGDGINSAPNNELSVFMNVNASTFDSRPIIGVL